MCDYTRSQASSVSSACDVSFFSSMLTSDVSVSLQKGSSIEAVDAGYVAIVESAL